MVASQQRPSEAWPRVVCPLMDLPLCAPASPTNFRAPGTPHARFFWFEAVRTGVREPGEGASQEAIPMEHGHFDRLARAMAAGVSRRSVLRRAAGSAMTSPLGLVGISAAA